MSKLPADTSRFLFSAAGMDILVSSFTVREQMSNLFSATVELASEEEIADDSVLGRTGLLTIESDEKERHVHGIVKEFYQTGFKGRFCLYQAVLAPQAHLLELRSDCRIFQNRNVPAIVGEVLKEAGLTADLFTFRLQDKYPVRVYCVQYRETDLDFIARLLAEEGIFFYFEHSRGKHLMVFGDSTACYQPIAGTGQVPWKTGDGLVAEQETVIDFKRGSRLHSGSYSQRDFNFEKPALDLTTADQDRENGRLALYDFPGDYALPEQGRRLSRVRLQAAMVRRAQASGKSAVPRFAPGNTFQLTGDGIGKMQDTYLLTKLEHEGEQPQVLAEQSDHNYGTSYTNKFEAIPAAVTFRPGFKGLEKPVVQGTQTAMVTGPAGEEIYTDRFGRVKVQFHWDRQGKRDENSSCWIWVSQNWAGAGWGAVQIPRIGQEVIVSFLEGDPDRPYVTGRAYHGGNLPPYGLPENKTVTTLKTLSSPGGDGFNELRFEDKKGSEQIFIHAQKDMDLRVINDRRTHIGADNHVIVQKDLYEQVNGAHYYIVKADHVRQIEGTESATTSRDFQHQIGNNYGLQAANQGHIAIGTHLVIEAGTSLTLKAGAGFITLDAGGVKISGPGIGLNSGGRPGAGRGVFTQVPIAPLEAVMALPGRVENNPAVQTGRTNASFPLVSSGAAPQKASAGSATAIDPAIAQEILRVKFHFQYNTLDKTLYLKDGFDLNGPRPIQWPASRNKRYQSINLDPMPAGSYTFDFAAYDLPSDSLKKS